jgi:Rod binding domain-containing protein
MQIAPIPATNASSSETQRIAKLKDGAHQFEAMMLQQMLRTVKFGTAPGDGEDESEGNALQGYGTEALAKSIAAAGGFGIANQIIRQVTAEDRSKGIGKGSKVS